jgi:hypothetical protein
MKKMFVLLAAFAATSAIAAGSAFAGAPPTTCGSTDLYNPAHVSGTVQGNLTVPAGMWCVTDTGTEVKGVANVSGHLTSFNTLFDTNVVVSGGSFQAVNGYTTILGNLNISNSAGNSDPRTANQNGFWGPGNHVAKNLNYQGNAGLWFGPDYYVTIDGSQTFLP